MLPIANELQEILPGIFHWEVYSPEHKVALTSHAIIVAARLFCFDPIPLAEAAFAELSKRGRPAAIMVTNENHERDCRRWAERWQAPLVTAATGLLPEGIAILGRHTRQWEGFEVHFLDGGPEGELAWRLRDASLVIFGDAVFNLPHHGFGVLSEKYCRDRAALKRSLRKLVAEPFERALFAHGAPLLEGASARIAALL